MTILKIFGQVLCVIAYVVFFVIIMLSILLPQGFLVNAKDAKNFDEWSSGASRGNSITVSGYLKEKDEFKMEGKNWFYFVLEGCQEGFFSSEDIGNEGKAVIVKVDRSEFGNEVNISYSYFVFSKLPYIIAGSISVAIFFFGLLLIFIHFLRARKGRHKKTMVDATDKDQISSDNVFNKNCPKCNCMIKESYRICPECYSNLK